MIFQKLRELREYNGMTQKDVAELIHVSRSVYAAYENGIRIIPLKHLLELAKFYQISLDYFIGFSNETSAVEIKDDFSLNAMEIGKKIKEVRKDFQLSLRDLAIDLNTTPSTICAYENGKTLLLTAFATQIGKKYNISLDWLCGLSNNKFINPRKKK